MHRISFTLALLFVLLTLTSAPLAQDNNQVETLKLGIIHTNDTHGKLLPFYANGENGWGGVAKRRVAIQRARSDTDYYWLVLHAGDAFQGSPISNLLTGFLDIECMNQMGYDAMCLGNHEFDFGYDLLRSRFTDANFAIVCANVIDRERGVPVAPPYKILRRGDYRIGIIGLTTETLLTETHPTIDKYVDAVPAIPVASNMAKYLRSIGCDIVIALTHQGYKRDLAMAEAVPELDLVVGGHTHTDLTEPTVVGKVLVTQDFQWGERLGILKLTLERPADDPDARFQVVAVDNEFKPLSPNEPDDGGMQAFLNDYQRRFAAEMGKIVCTAAHDFPVMDVRLAENALANIICDSMRKATESDVALFNGGNFRAGLHTGEVTFGDLYEVLPYDNFMMRVPVTGAKLLECLEFAAAQYGDGGFPQVSGMKLHIIDMELASALVDDGNGGWAEIDSGREYTMLVTDFLAIGGDGFPLKEDPYGPGYTGLEQRAAFALWASQERLLEGTIDGRVIVDWVTMENPGLAD